MPCFARSRMQCSLGSLSPADNLVCREPIFSRKDFSRKDWEIIKLRSSCDLLSTICLNHKRKYVTFFTFKKKQKCCDPFQIHKKSTIPVKEISYLWHLKSKVSSSFGSPLIPGLKLCRRCAVDINSLLKGIAVGEESEGEDSSSCSESEQDLNLVERVIAQAGSVHNVIYGPSSSTQQATPPAGGFSREQSQYLFADLDDQDLDKDSLSHEVSASNDNVATSAPYQLRSRVSTQPQAGGSCQAQALCKAESDSIFGTSLSGTFNSSSYHLSSTNAALMKVNTFHGELMECPVLKIEIKEEPIYE